MEAQARQLESKLLQVQSSVHGDRGKLRRDVVKVHGDKYTNDVARISKDLAEYASYLERNGFASEELKDDFRDTYMKLEVKEGEIAKFLKENKGEQFNATKLLLHAQKQREKAYDLATQLKLEHELKKPAGKTPRAFPTCVICDASTASFEIHCEQHAFCPTCVMQYIKGRADQNLPAYCPGGCKQELLQEEIDRACQLAGQPEVGGFKFTGYNMSALT